jgi:PAS domain S-box-containing protein
MSRAGHSTKKTTAHKEPPKRQAAALKKQLALCRRRLRKIESERNLYRQTLENSNDVIYLLNLETREFEYVNSLVNQLGGFTTKEFIAMGLDGVLARLHPDDRARYIKKVQKDLALSSDIKPQGWPGFEFRMRCKNNRYRWFNARFAYIRAKEGPPTAKVGVVRDVTYYKNLQHQIDLKHQHLKILVEQRTSDLKKRNKLLKQEVLKRKATEDSLAKERNLLRSLIDAIPDNIYVKDHNNRFILCNQRLAVQAGLESPDQIVGKSDYDFLRTELADKYFAQEKEIFRTGKPCINEEQIGRDSRGNDTWVLSSKIPLLDQHGQVVGIIGSNRDITRRKLAEQELADYREKIVQTEQISQLGVLSATMAHELNQPLTVIQLLIQDCLAELEKNPGSAGLADNLKDSLAEVESANGIIHRYRSVLRTRQEGISRLVHVHAVARRIAEALHKTAEHHQVEIRIDDFSHLPPLRGKVQDYEQIFFILIQNAIQAAGQKAPHVIHITGQALENHIELRFADDCGGILPEHLDKIFDLFFTTKTHQIGTGLGLCIARRVLQNYEGKLTVESRYGQGSTFYVNIPLPGKPE